MPRVAITDPAQNDLEDIYSHYAPLVGESEAEAIVVRILEQLEHLETFVGMGRPSLKPGVREVVITRYPFIAPYRLEHDEIQILRVVHQRAQYAKDW